jgi:hypothetical protein
VERWGKGREGGGKGREGGKGPMVELAPPPRTQFLSTPLVSAYSIWPKTRPVAGRGGRLNPMSFVWGGGVGRQAKT